MKRIELPKEVKDVIQEYRALDILGKKVNAPYYRNIARVRAELRSLVGKGTPEEIIEDVLIFSKLRGFDIRNSTAEQIREFMEKEGIGIDCSGFVAHIYDRWLSISGKGGIGTYINRPPIKFTRRLINMIRPIENISADQLTGTLNCDPIALKDVRPGDLIRLKGATQGEHVVIISSVSIDENNLPTRIEYTHSSPHYGRENGIRTGAIKITDIQKGLEDQEWLELDSSGVCQTKAGYLRGIEDNGLMRPKFIGELKWDQ